ncbi:hypothetical protein HDU98_000368 [Podochytrium sp. JEL0797]|nr:hypothetical protein HDU98_000368 [Podochytrium sp. JEL0797]
MPKTRTYTDEETAIRRLTQTREAQRAFRARKLAAQEALFTRVSDLETALMQSEAANQSLVQQMQHLQMQDDLLRQHSHRIHSQQPLENAMASQVMHFHEPIRLPPVGQMVDVNQRSGFMEECGGTPPMDYPNRKCKKSGFWATVF